MEELGARQAIGRIVASSQPLRESPLELVLAPALLKGAKMDLVVEKATELGRAPPGARDHGSRRGRRLAPGAVAAHCRGGREAVGSRPRSDRRFALPLDTVARAPWSGLRLVPWEEESSRRFDDLPERTAAVVALVGPEGGLADDEVTLLVAHGFVPITLGPRVLRAETAAVAMAAHCQRRWGDG